MGNNFCSNCKKKSEQVTLIQLTCQHHTCSNCIKDDYMFKCKYKFIQCFNCKKKSLVNKQAQCITVNEEQEWQKCKKQKFTSEAYNNEKEYYQWLRQKKIYSLQQNIRTALSEKTTSAEQFEKVVIDNNLDIKAEVLKNYQTAILKVDKEKYKNLAFQAEYSINGKDQGSNQLCKLCFKNKAQYCVNNCGHVCLCQEHLSLTSCPICQTQGKVIKIYLPEKSKN